MFANDTEANLAFAAALVNTAYGEKLPDVGALDAFVREWKWTGHRAHTAAELKAVQALRVKLRRIWDADEDEVARIVNGLLRDAHALPQLVKHDDLGYHLHATSPQAPLATRMAVEVAMAFMDVVRTGELPRLRTCRASDCRNVVIDLSKNRSKLFCDDGCGNRVAVAAYRQRRRKPRRVLPRGFEGDAR
jgi:predicted RNA-binding Zn ribbon-like protein